MPTLPRRRLAPDELDKHLAKRVPAYLVCKQVGRVPQGDHRSNYASCLQTLQEVDDDGRAVQRSTLNTVIIELNPIGDDNKSPEL